MQGQWIPGDKVEVEGDPADGFKNSWCVTWTVLELLLGLVYVETTLGLGLLLVIRPACCLTAAWKGVSRAYRA